MMKGKIIWIVLGVVALALVAWMIFGTKKGRDGFPLKSGDRGDQVKALQEALNTKLEGTTVEALAVDGIFGPLTEGALLHITGKTTITKSELNKLKEQKTDG